MADQGVESGGNVVRSTEECVREKRGSWWVIMLAGLHFVDVPVALGVRVATTLNLLHRVIAAASSWRECFGIFRSSSRLRRAIPIVLGQTLCASCSISESKIALGEAIIQFYRY